MNDARPLSVVRPSVVRCPSVLPPNKPIEPPKPTMNLEENTEKHKKYNLADSNQRLRDERAGTDPAIPRSIAVITIILIYIYIYNVIYICVFF